MSLDLAYHLRHKRMPQNDSVLAIFDALSELQLQLQQLFVLRPLQVDEGAMFD